MKSQAGAAEAHRTAIEKTAQAILDARARFPEASLAAYGMKPDTPEPHIVAELMAHYRAMTGSRHPMPHNIPTSNTPYLLLM